MDRSKDDYHPYTTPYTGTGEVRTDEGWINSRDLGAPSVVSGPGASPKANSGFHHAAVTDEAFSLPPDATKVTYHNGRYYYPFPEDKTTKRTKNVAFPSLGGGMSKLSVGNIHASTSRDGGMGRDGSKTRGEDLAKHGANIENLVFKTKALGIAELPTKDVFDPIRQNSKLLNIPKHQDLRKMSCTDIATEVGKLLVHKGCIYDRLRGILTTNNSSGYELYNSLFKEHLHQIKQIDQCIHAYLEHQSYRAEKIDNLIKGSIDGSELQDDEEWQNVSPLK